MLLLIPYKFDGPGSHHILHGRSCFRKALKWETTNITFLDKKEDGSNRIEINLHRPTLWWQDEMERDFCKQVARVEEAHSEQSNAERHTAASILR